MFTLFKIIDLSSIYRRNTLSYSTSPGEIISFIPTFHKFKFISYIRKDIYDMPRMSFEFGMFIKI